MKNNRLQTLRMALIISLATIGISTEAANDKKSVGQVTETVTITTDTDYWILSSNPFGDNGVVNIENTEHAVLILSNSKPSAAIKLLADHVQIAGSKAVNGQNCQVKIYNRGCIILPYGDNAKPLTVYSEPNYGGTAVNDFGLENDNGFMNTLTDEKLNNKIRSFKLKRGYMVTFALRSGGYGYSRCFIADNADLEFPELPAELDSKISSYRIFKWYDTGKQQLANADGDYATCNALKVTSTYTWGVGQNMGPDIESVPVHIKENWPAPADLGKATWSPHMKTNNEPKNPADESPCELKDILANWEALMATGMRLCSPSSWDGSDYWSGTGFLKDFFNEIDSRGWRCDIIDLHGYWAEGSFTTNIPNWYNSVKRPVWVSEWVWGASWNNNGAFASGATEAQNAAAVKRICEKMNNMAYVERYYYWNNERDPSKVYKNGALTEAGEYYATINSGLGYNSKYDYVPKAVVSTPTMSAKFTESTKTTKLQWWDKGCELVKQMTVERRSTGSSTWQTIATMPTNETSKYLSYEDTQSGYGLEYRIHIVDYKGDDVYSNTFAVMKDEKVYLYNVGAKQWLTGANSWGTKASLTPYGGLDVTISSDNDGNCTIETGIVNGDNHYLNIDGTAAWVDQKQGYWTMTAVEEMNGKPTYTLSMNGQNLQYDGSSSALTLGTGTDVNAQWLKVTESERTEMMKTATTISPVDATHLIPGANFSIYDSRNSNWKGEPQLGGEQSSTQGNYCAEKYNTTFDVYQATTANLPTGRYKLSVQGFYREGPYAAAATKHNNGSEALNASFYLRSMSLPLQSIFNEAGKLDVGKTTSGINGKFPDSMTDASKFFSAGYYDNAMKFDLTLGGAVRIGVKKTAEVANDWTIFDNFRLEYLGDFSSVTLSTKAIDGRNWATFFCTACAYELPAEATAYTATIEGSTLTLHQLGNIVPMRCAVIIISESTDDVVMNRVNYTADTDTEAQIKENVLTGTDHDMIPTSKYLKYFTLGTANDKKCAFLLQKSNVVLASEQAYVTQPTSSTIETINVKIDDTPVSIRTVTDKTLPAADAIYDLQGRQVQNPQPGSIYIRNGKKVRW